MVKYVLAARVTLSLPPIAPSTTVTSGICSAIRVAPINAATIKPRIRIAGNSSGSPAPSACAVKATVLMRRKPNSQNVQSKITEAIATPPSSAASPSLPIAVVATMPINGVVKLATIAGQAMANTRAVVTLVWNCEEINSTLSCTRGLV